MIWWQIVNNWLFLALAFLLYIVILYRNPNTCFVYKDPWDPGCTTTRQYLLGPKLTSCQSVWFSNGIWIQDQFSNVKVIWLADLNCLVQWGSECQTWYLVFKWSKRGWMPNGPAFIWIPDSQTVWIPDKWTLYCFLMYWSSIRIVGLVHKTACKPTIWIPNYLKSKLEKGWYSNASGIQMVGIQMAGVQIVGIQMVRIQMVSI